MQNEKTTTKFWSFWLQWTLANGFSWLIGMSLAWMLSTLVEPLTSGVWLVVFWLIAGMLIGAFFSINHWFLFRPIRIRFQGNWVGQWFVVTILGWGISLGLISGTGLAANQGLALAGFFVGVLIGSLQWLVLRHHIPRAWIWILAQTLAWFTAIALIEVWGQAVGFAFSGFISGFISGGILAYLFKSTDTIKTE